MENIKQPPRVYQEEACRQWGLGRYLVEPHAE